MTPHEKQILELLRKAMDAHRNQMELLVSCQLVIERLMLDRQYVLMSLDYLTAEGNTQTAKDMQDNMKLIINRLKRKDNA